MTPTTHSSKTLLEDWILYDFFDESNKIIYSFYTVFKKIFCNIFALCLLLSVLSDLLNQILIFIIHHCYERSHLRIRALSVEKEYQKVIIRFFNYTFPFCGILLRQRNSSIGYLLWYLVLRVIRYSIDSRNSFWFTKNFL